MNDIEQQIKKLRRLYVGNVCNIKYSKFDITGCINFIGRSPLSELTGSTYITITCDRFPIRVNRNRLLEVQWTILSNDSQHVIH